MMAEKLQPKVTVPQGRLTAALTLFVIAIACPIVGTAIIASDAPEGWKMAAGLLYFPIPEAFDLAAIAILGKPGFAWLKAKVFAWFRKQGPPDEVSRRRYTLGLVMFCVPILFSWVSPYASSWVPGVTTHPLLFALGGDFLLLTSLFVLGGDFWDKVRALFVCDAKAQFPSPTSNVTAPETRG